jgi:hypothetical protein
VDVQGRTSPDYEDYWSVDPQPRIQKARDVTDGEPGVAIYHGMPPCGHRFYFNERHVVEEHEDGTFSVTPQPTPPQGMNSILCRACGWHGYVYRNVWREV